MTITPFIVPDWTSPDGRIVLYCGESLDVLRTLNTAGVDALCTDPPFSSGGFTRADRNLKPVDKYQSDGTKRTFPDFGGDSRSQRGWAYWTALWLSECYRIVKPGGIAQMFTDWRQLATGGDALEAGGFIHRATMVWDKGRGARAPHKGYPRHQSEFILFGSHGPMKPTTHAGPFDGVITCSVKQKDKHHTTGKPTNVMLKLVEFAAPDAVILDPFMGSGTTGVAAVRLGRQFIGIEQSREYFNVAVQRITGELAGGRAIAA